MSSMEAKKLKIKQLNQDLANYSQKFEEIVSNLNVKPDPIMIVDNHIKQLKKYNEIKDTTLKLMEMIANLRMMSIDEIAAEMKVDIHD